MAHPPMPKTMAYMQKFSPKRRVAIGFICSLAICVAICFSDKEEKAVWNKKSNRGFQEPKKQ